MREIRTSAKALVIKDDKMLAIKISDDSGTWYIMPGGGQDADEPLTATVQREVAEETGLKIDVHELLFVIEGIKGEPFHRIDMVFRCEYLGEIQHPMLHHDTNQTGVEWLPLHQLKLLPLYPSKLRRQIMNFYEHKPYQVYLGNEEVGDPEVTD